MEAWTNLKEQIIRLVKHGIVYHQFKAPQTIAGQELLNRKLQVSWDYEEKYIALEKKFERVKGLVVEDKIEKLKYLLKRGEI